MALGPMQICEWKTSMKNAASRRMLKAIFELKADDRSISSEEYVVSELPLPTLDERIDLYSLVVYGPNYTMTSEERQAERDRILDVLADEATGSLFENNRYDESSTGGVHSLIAEEKSQEALSAARIPHDAGRLTEPVNQPLFVGRRVQQGQRSRLGTPRFFRVAYVATAAFVLVLGAGAGIWTGIFNFVDF